MRLRIVRSLGITGAAIILAMNLAGGGLAQKRRRRKPAHKPPTAFAACLPANVNASEIAVYGYNGKSNVTVAEKVEELKGRCHDGRLVGPDEKEIRFFRLQCWGNPPSNYQEILADERRNLEILKAKNTVIVIDCDPRIS